MESPRGKIAGLPEGGTDVLTNTDSWSGRVMLELQCALNDDRGSMSGEDERSLF